MFLSALQGYIVAIIISVVVLQYAFALFCLLKLAYTDVTKQEYILWNVFILLVFFIGGAVFLVYYYMHPDKRVSKEPTLAASADAQPDTAENGADGGTPFDNGTEAPENGEDANGEDADGEDADGEDQ